MFRFEISQRETLQDAKDPAVPEPSRDTVMKDSSLAFELHGSQFETRATDRATKKFKQRNLLNL